MDCVDQVYLIIPLIFNRFVYRVTEALHNLEFRPGHNKRQTAQRVVNPFCQLCRWSRLAPVSLFVFLPPCLPLLVKQLSLLKQESLSPLRRQTCSLTHPTRELQSPSPRPCIWPQTHTQPALCGLGRNTLWNISFFHQFRFAQCGFPSATKPIQIHTNVGKCIYINASRRSLNIQAWHFPTLKRALHGQAPMNGWSQQSSMCPAQALEEYTNTERWRLTTRLYGKRRPACT